MEEENEMKNIAQNLADEIGAGFSEYLKNHPIDIERLAKKDTLNEASKDDLIKEVMRLRDLNKENSYLLAKLQITDTGYAKCAEERDEYKHQLNAANKEIEALKSRVEEIDSDVNRKLSDDLFCLKNDYAVLKHIKNKEIDELKKENEMLLSRNRFLEGWQKDQLTVMKQWDEVDQYVRGHKDTVLGEFIAGTCLHFLKERDELKKQQERDYKEIKNIKELYGAWKDESMHDFVARLASTEKALLEELEKYRLSNVAYVKMAEGAKETIDKLKEENERLLKEYNKELKSDEHIWRNTVIDSLTCLHILEKEHYDNPSKALHDIINWNVSVALDPRVSEDAQKLIDEGKKKAEDNLMFTIECKDKTLKNYEDEIDRLILKNRNLIAENTTLKEFTSQILKNSAKWYKENNIE